MAEENANELFPESQDPKRKLRGFSRAPLVTTAPGQPTKQQVKKQPVKKKQGNAEPTQGARPKKIVVKGYEQSKAGQGTKGIRQEKNGDQQADWGKVVEVGLGQGPAANRNTAIDQPTMLQKEMQPKTHANLATIDKDSILQMKMPLSDSSLEYYGENQYVSSEEDNEEWVKFKKIKKEPVNEEERGGKMLTGLISSPSLDKGKNHEPRQLSTGPSQAQASALLKIKAALEESDFERHTELMTAYLIRYNPEKLRVLAVDKLKPTGNEGVPPTQTKPMQNSPPTPEHEPTVDKLKQVKVTAKRIPPGRPLSDHDTEEHGGQSGGGFVENGIEFADGLVPSHHMIQLTVFWDNRIRKIKGYVPVLMFNKAWLEANRDIEGRKSSKKRKEEDDDSDEEKYEGLSYPSELRLTYGDWVTCFNLMIDYLKAWFNFEKLVIKFENHKKNVDAVKGENDDNWMVALRYDIMIRRQFWTTRVEGGKVGDPAVEEIGPTTFRVTIGTTIGTGTHNTRTLIGMTILLADSGGAAIGGPLKGMTGQGPQYDEIDLLNVLTEMTEETTTEMVDSDK
ncbi:hypothetical protein DFH28DRAFT_1086084 [Melampsora americana]|nr:hypothetical protein DFH28DRAFT_1086084 [Melampsora americana]